MLRHLSTFSGIGGFDLAFERAGMTSVGSVEFDPRCRQVLAAHWPDVPQHTDVKEFDGSSVRFDVLSGGFPCQDLSIAGRRAGLAGERSGLFFEFARIADEAKPQWVILENVPGLLSSNGGRDMGTVIGTLADLGYGVSWRVLDAQYFGVAQRRRRVFIVGSLGDDGGRSVLLEPEGVRRDPPSRREASQEHSAGASGGARVRGFGLNGDPLTSGPFGTNAQGGLRTTDLDTIGAYIVHEFPTHDVSPCLQERGYKGVDSDMTQAHVVRLRPTISVRRLTPTECERLQGFPDGWTGGQVDSARYRQLGNAVAVPVVEWIGRRIVAASQENHAAA